MEVAEQVGVPAGWEVVSAPTAPPSSGAHDFKVFGVNVHVPGAEKPRADSNMIGWGTEGAGIAPEDALAVGQVGRSVVKAASGGGVVAGVKDAIANAAPIAKYEIAHHMLKLGGLPDSVAIPVAMAISGYKKGAKEATAPPNPNAPHLDRSVPVQAGSLTREQLAERMKYGQGTPTVMRNADGRPAGKAPITAASAQPVGESAVSPAASSPAAPTPPTEPVARTGAARSTPETQSPARPSSQKALNEEALARRRDAYQKQLATQPQPKARLVGQESKEYMRLRQSGMTHPEAMEAIDAQRVFQQRFGLATPTHAETTFPKGMRGKATKE